MLPKPESACFVIADISGYTSFLAGVELDHAHDIIADVMDTVVRRLRPPFRLAKFEGDAAFFYAVDRQGRRIAAPGRHRVGLLRLPQAAAQHQAGDLLRVQRLQEDAGPRPQVRQPPWRVHQAQDGGPRGARRSRCHPHSSPAEERGERAPRWPRLCAVFRRLHPGDGHRSSRAGSHRAPGVDRHHRRREVLGARSRRGMETKTTASATK